MTDWVHTQCEQCYFVLLAAPSRACAMFMRVRMLLGVRHVRTSADDRPPARRTQTSATARWERLCRLGGRRRPRPATAPCWRPGPSIGKLLLPRVQTKLCNCTTADDKWAEVTTGISQPSTSARRDARPVHVNHFLCLHVYDRDRGEE